MTAKELLYTILELTTRNKFPDIHFNTWYYPIIRNHNWDITFLETITLDSWEEISLEKLSKETVKDLIIFITWENWFEKFSKNLELDTSFKYEAWDRYRINCYSDTAWYSIAMRIIPSKIPTLEELWLSDTIKELCNKAKWLILLTWPTWSWKSTNAAAMIDYLNKTFNKHIITIEDPVEFNFTSNKCLINQREVWHNTHWFPEAIRASLREDPDIIMVWEMRDSETMKAALTLAETWHLVISTLHTNDSVQSIDRIIDWFPSTQQDQMRMQLAMSLNWILSQRLVARIDKPWRVAAREILINNDAVKNLIITWKTHQIYSVVELCQKEWMVLMDKYFTVLYKKWYISKETLISNVRDKEAVEMSIDE